MQLDLGGIKLDVYLHDVEPHARIITLLNQLITQGETLMAKFQDFQADLDKLKTDISAKLDALAKTIADLKAQIAAGSPVTQEQLDAVDAEVQAIDASLTPAV